MCEPHIGRVAASWAGNRSSLRNGLAAYFEGLRAAPWLPTGPMESLPMRTDWPAQRPLEGSFGEFGGTKEGMAYELE
jgi:hypothetical protein